jgi:hypothetical protein
MLSISNSMSKFNSLLVFLFCMSAVSVHAKTSAEERAELNYEANVQFGADYRVDSVQFMFAKFLDDRSVIGLKGGSGSRYEKSQTTFAVQYKNFVGNTFYMAPEIFYLNYADTAGYSYDERLTGLGAHFRIGNQWQWEHFTLGCDWVGVGRVFVIFNNTDEYGDTDYLTLSVANFYLGYSF